MRIITDYKNYDPITEPTALALGFFDGFHIGHTELLKAAKKTGLKTGVVTFANAPISFIKKENEARTIMNNEDKIEFLRAYGIDYLIMPVFDDEIMHMSKEDFVKFFICAFNAKAVISGFNFTFGRNKEGNTDNLASLTEPYGIKTQIIPAVKCGGVIVSSTLIRECLREGDVKKAAEYLGRYYSFSGKVVNGRKIGRTLGFPTANTVTESDILKPKWGVYHTVTEFEGKRYNSVTNIGDNPTVNGDGATVETYILGFEGDLYDKSIRLYFISRIRDQLKFADKNELKAQISRDIKYVTENGDGIQDNNFGL